jgi:prepilin-type N-terminal cleavage/methylation domain-containing protein/prepilin-type processing-associated H-X9-DG protein
MFSTSRSGRRGFTLVELLVVIGIIAIMVGILLPTLNKARKSAKTTVCLSNLKQMGNAWTMYLSDYKGHLPHSIWHDPPYPYASSMPPGWTTKRLNEYIWHGYWFGILGDYRVNSVQLLCPEAQDPSLADYDALYGGIKGGGSVFEAWSGQHQSASPVGIMIDNKKINPTNDAHWKTNGGYRIGSYGFNGNLYFGKGPDNKFNTADDGPKGKDPGTGGSSAACFGSNIAHVKNTSEVPAFLDCGWIDFQDMPNGTPQAMPTPPPNLGGQQAPKGSTNNHWRILLARHGRGINVCFADGSAKWVGLEDLYQQKWTPYWRPYALNNLPRK